MRCGAACGGRATPVNWKLPNQLTVGRIVLAAAFFVLLGLYQPDSPGGPMLLNTAFVVFVVAGITDILDGYLARKWQVTSAFGRIVDPIVDKVLIVGGFVMLTGSNFSWAAGASVSAIEEQMPAWLTGRMLSAVQAWMAVTILAREFIVSAVRSYSESRGQAFPASPIGKTKMFIQSLAVGTVLVQLADLRLTAWAIYLKVIMVWAATVITVLSGLLYIGKARRLLVSDE